VKLKRLIFENYRGLVNYKYKPKRINIIIGRNNTGKSTLLQGAYLFLTGNLGYRYDNELFPFDDHMSRTPYEINIHAVKASLSDGHRKLRIFKGLEYLDKSDEQRVLRKLYHFIIKVFKHKKDKELELIK
jgi:AAA15 family ATPase/GTPase